MINTIGNNRRLDKPYKRVYKCRRKACEPDRGCENCQMYRCLGCNHLRSWDDGGTNNELCDDCDLVVASAVREIFTNGERLS